MKCPKCDIRYESDVSFCAECGSKLIKCRSLDEANGKIKKAHIKNKSDNNTLKNNDSKSLDLQLMKLDVIIEQNSRIIELLEEMARK